MSVVEPKFAPKKDSVSYAKYALMAFFVIKHKKSLEDLIDMDPREALELIGACKDEETIEKLKDTLRVKEVFLKYWKSAAESIKETNLFFCGRKSKNSDERKMSYSALSSQFKYWLAGQELNFELIGLQVKAPIGRLENKPLADLIGDAIEFLKK